MKTYTVTTYGDPAEVVKLQEVEQPQPQGKQVLVKVMAGSVNDYDWSASSGMPKSYRLLFGLTKPRKQFQRLGMEVAGVIETIGPEVTKFKVGDRVYGDTSNDTFGSLSEYMCVSEAALCLMSDRMSFTDAVAIPHAAMLAYEGLFDIGKLKPGQKLLINGAGGGMGTFGLQIAKTLGVEVTGVDAAHKFEMMRDLGYDQLIDYKQVDFTQNGQQYDLILDAKMNRSPWKFLKSLKPKGKYVSVGGNSGKLLQMAFLGAPIKWLTGKSVRILALEPNKYLDEMNEMYEAGTIKPVIDGPHPFDKVPELIKYFGEARHKGKIVITMEEDIL